jgi:DedD protein
MERKLQERMVGAGVLVLALVILGPLVLDGGSREPVEPDAVPGQRADELRSHTFRIGEPAGAMPAVQSPSMAPPAQPDVTPGAAAASPAATAESEPPPAPARPSTAQSAEVLPSPAPPSAAPPGPAPPPPPVTRSETRATPPPAASSEARPAAANGAWLVQVGTFGQKDNADRLAGSLKRQGFAAFISPTTRAGKTLYRVRVGPTGSREDATAVAGRLAAAGQAGQVVAQ